MCDSVSWTTLPSNETTVTMHSTGSDMKVHDDRYADGNGVDDTDPAPLPFDHD